jgi:hypothetical protein
LLASDTLRRIHAVDGLIARNAPLGAVAPLPAAGQVRVSHPDWGDSCRQGTSSLTPSGTTTAPVGRHAMRPTAPGPQDRANVAAGADITWRTGTGTSSRTSTAAHSSSPSQTLSKLASSMAHLTICQPPWRCTVPRKGCGLRPLCGRARRPGNAQPTCERAGQAGLGLVGFGPGCTSSLTDDPSLPEPSRRPTSVSAG